MLTSGADATCEHQIELLRLRHLIVCVWISYLVLAAQLPKFWTGMVVQLAARGSDQALQLVPDMLSVVLT